MRSFTIENKLQDLLISHSVSLVAEMSTKPNAQTCETNAQVYQLLIDSN